MFHEEDTYFHLNLSVDQKRLSFCTDLYLQKQDHVASLHKGHSCFSVKSGRFCRESIQKQALPYLSCVSALYVQQVPLSSI